MQCNQQNAAADGGFELGENGKPKCLHRAFAQRQADFLQGAVEPFERGGNGQIGERRVAEAQNGNRAEQPFHAESQANPSKTAHKSGNAQRQGNGRLKKRFAPKTAAFQQKRTNRADGNCHGGYAHHQVKRIEQQLRHARPP